MGRIVRIILFAIAACAVLTGISLFVAFGATQPVVDAGGAFFSALQEERLDDAYAMFTSALAGEVSQSDFRGLFDGVEVGEWILNSRQIRNSIGQLEGTVVIDSETYQYVLGFINSDGKWLLDSYSFKR
jgi:hypothetical protein